MSKFTSALLTGVSPFLLSWRPLGLGDELSAYRALSEGCSDIGEVHQNIDLRQSPYTHSLVFIRLRASHRGHRPRQLPNRHLQFVTGIQPMRLRPKSQGNLLSR